MYPHWLASHQITPKLFSMKSIRNAKDFKNFSDRYNHTELIVKGISKKLNYTVELNGVAISKYIHCTQVSNYFHQDFFSFLQNSYRDVLPNLKKAFLNVFWFTLYTLLSDGYAKLL